MKNALALVTGAGRGIGRAIAMALAAEKIPVVLVARSSEEITLVRNTIVEAGGRAYACPCDITRPEEVNALQQDIAADLGTVTILVNNAGIAPSMKLEETSDDAWRETFAVNVDGPFFILRAFTPSMREQGATQIISVASTAAMQGYRFTAAYTASKHALLGLMRAATEEMRSSDITLSTICPGFTRTQLIEESIIKQMARGKSRQEAEAAFGKMNREGRLIEPEEIAATVLQLVRERPRLTSGGVYNADGSPIS